MFKFQSKRNEIMNIKNDILIILNDLINQTIFNLKGHKLIFLGLVHWKTFFHRFVDHFPIFVALFYLDFFYLRKVVFSTE